MPSEQSPEVLSAASAPLLNGRYELNEKIGEGSFFTVYRGRDTGSVRLLENSTMIRIDHGRRR